MFIKRLTIVCLLFAIASMATAQDAQPKPIPKTRPEMKAALEKLKSRTPRLPMPPVTEEEKERAAANATSSLGGGIVNNARMRNLYLPEELRTGGFSRQKDPVMTLDNTLAVELFWIASRVNNCHYCLGHQEVKLKSAGVSDDTLAALDCKWEQFTPRERAAFAFARKLTYEPQNVNDSDYTALREHFNPNEALEIAYYVARYNSTNRWTDSLGIPQEDHRELATPTAEAFQTAESTVAVSKITERGAVPSRADVQQAWEAARNRTARAPLASLEDTQKLLSANSTTKTPANWERALANFPVTGLSAIEGYRKATQVGKLSPELRAQIAWTCARQDRAAYALGHAAARLREIGYTADRCFALDNLADQPVATRAALALAVKLTTKPQMITDQDIAAVRQHFGDHETAEIVHHITQAAFFDRLTEATNLPLEFDPF